MLRNTVGWAIAFLLMVSGTYGEYEYYKGAQFPGKELREDVELRTVVREGGEPTEYQRREVKFFPRKGVDEIPVFCCGEFGRSPDNGQRGGAAWAGRDHNAKAMTVWLAGGGTKAGHIIGATDEIGDRAVDVVHPIKDLHVTLLHLLGLNDNKLTFFDQGRYKQLSQTGGQLIPEILA
jgi:hypothetical protein